VVEHLIDWQRQPFHPILLRDTMNDLMTTSGELDHRWLLHASTATLQCLPQAKVTPYITVHRTAHRN
jgi:hypothetical protein